MTNNKLMKMKAKSILLLGALVCSFGIMSCSTETVTPESTPTTNGGGNGGNNGGGTNLRPQKGLLEGFVRDTEGKPIENVTVSSGETTTTTDQNGFFALTQLSLNGQRAIVKFSSSSHADVVRSTIFKTGETWDIVMVRNSNGYEANIPSKTEYNIESTLDRAISVNSNAASTTKTMEVELKGDGYKDVETGLPFTGRVTAAVTYLDPDATETFADQMPGGDLAAVDKDGNDMQLVSYGMTAVSLTDSNGKPLQLTGDKPAELTFPVPENVKNMRVEDRPATIPLWSFDETKGVWVEEGVATYDATNDVYVGSVKHFSWVNLDYPEIRVTVNGAVKDAEGNGIPYLKVYVGQTSAITDANGKYQVNIPRKTKVKIWVRSFDYGNYAKDDSEIKFVEVPATEDATYTAEDIILPALGQVSGTIENQGTGGNIATVWVEYNQNGQKAETKKVRTGETGAFKIQAPSGYTGEAVVRVSTADGTTVSKAIQLTGGNVSVGTITIKSNKSETGSISLRLQNGQTVSVNINNVGPYDQSGVVINGTNMDVQTNMEMDWERLEKEGGYALHMHGLDIPNYTGPGEYVLPQFQTALMYVGNDQSGSGDKNRENWIFFESLKINIARNGDKFTFTIPNNIGKMQIWDESGDREEDVTLSGSFTVDLYYEGEVVENVGPTDSRIPSFMKSLLTEMGTSPKAYVIKSSPKLGKGINLAYMGNAETFNALKEQAATLGLKDYSADMGGESTAVFYSDGKWLKIMFNEWYANPGYGTSGRIDTPWSFGSAFAPINIVALEGTIFYITDLQYFVKKNNPTNWDE